MDGPGNVSTPRLIQETRPEYAIIQITGAPAFKITGDFVNRFPTGAAFSVVNSTSIPTNNGAYIVIAPGASLSGPDTIIPVAAIPNLAGCPVPAPSCGVVRLNALVLNDDLTFRFISGFTFTVSNSGGGLNDGLKTVTAFGSYLAGTLVNPVTIIPVTVAIPSIGLPYGDIQYTIGASTSLLLPGRGTMNYGESILEDLVHHLENFADTTPPPGTPSVGQFWYDTTAGPDSDLFRHWDGVMWSADVYISSGTLTFDDPQNPNQPAQIEITGDDTDVGLRIRSTQPIQVANQSVFRVTDNAGLVGNALLRVEFSGYTRTSNNLEVQGLGDSYIYGRLGIGDNGLPTLVRTLTVEGNGIQVNSDTALDARLVLNNTAIPATNFAAIDFQKAGVLEGSILIDGTIAGPPLQINSNTVRNVNLVLGGGSVGIGISVPAVRLDVVGDIQSTIQFRGALQSAATPTYSFTADLNTGMYQGVGMPDTISFALAGTQKVRIDATGITVFSGYFSPGANTPATPEYTFTGDVDTGMYHPAIDTIGFSTGGVLRFSISNAGISSFVPFLAPDGSAAAPSYSFTSDTDTGMYYVAANTLGFSTDGMNRLSIDTNSIDTTVVISNILGTAAAPSYTFTGDLDTGMYNSAANEISFALAGVRKVKIDSTGITVFSGFFAPGLSGAPTPEFSFSNDTNTGLFRSAADTIGFAVGGIEGAKLTTGNILTVGTLATPGTITGADGTAAPGAILTIEAGDGDGAGNAGGAVTVRGGFATDGNGGAAIVSGRDATGTNRTGGELTLTAGNSTGTATGGELTLTAGQGGATGDGGDISLFSGDSPISGVGGNINLIGGNAVDSAAGSITLAAGTNLGTSDGGGISLFAGSAGTGSISGAINILAGSSFAAGSNGGNLLLAAGDTSDSSAGNVGIVAGSTLMSGAVAGNISLTAGTNIGTNAGGSISISAGGNPTTGNSGDINFIVDNAGGDGGNITFAWGTTGGTPGNMIVSLDGGFQQNRAGNFAVTGDAESNEYILRVTTTDATITEMFLDGAGASGRMVLASDSTWAFHIHIVARRTDANNESAEYLRKGAIDNNAGTTALVAAVQTLGTDIEDSAAWDITVTADNTNDSLKIEVTGEATKTIRWVAFVRTIEVTG